MNPDFAAQILALIAALTWAAGDTFARIALRTSTPITGTLVLASVTLVIFGPFALAASSSTALHYRGVLFFVAAGMGFGLARTLLNMSFQRVGLARSSSIVSASPLISVIIAAVWLSERPSLLVYLGTLLIMAGVMALARDLHAASRGEPRTRPVRHYFVFAVLAALMFGITTALRKVGVTLIPGLSAGLSVAALGTLLVVVLWHPLLPRADRIRLGRGNVGCFLLSGLLSSLSHWALFAALQRGSLSIVAPLASTTPLFVLLFAWLWFRDVERLSLRLVAGAFSIFAGAVLVTMSRGA